MRYLKSLLGASAEEWSVTLRLAEWIFLLPIVGTVAVAATRINISLYHFLLQDDGPIEWAQFLCFFVAFGAGIGVATQRIRAGHTQQGVLFITFALIMLFIAGEEISWGQRLLKLPTPEVLKTRNSQNEITLHNTGQLLAVFNLIMMLGGAYGSTAYFLARSLCLERYGEKVDHLLFVPPLFLVPCFLVVFIYKFLRFTMWPVAGLAVSRYSEWVELCMALGLCIFVCLNYQRLAARSKLASTYN